MRTIPGLSLPLLLAGALAGCTGQTMRIDTVTDPATIDRSRGREITARAQGFQLFAILPIEINSRHERAFQHLIEQAGEDVIADVTIRESWAYGVIGTSLTTEIKAMAYPRKRSNYPP